jgi:hypothetical protein
VANLLFQPAELVNELVALNGVASEFLDPASSYQLDALLGEIRGLQVRGGRHILQIDELRPLKTRVSNGEFEPPYKSSTRRVYGLITGIWELEAAKHPIPDPDRPNKKAKEKMLIGFIGKASTVFEVKDEASGDSLARWKMELGDASSPGCFFHTFSSSDHGFPVPRHPNVFATPMSAIGFALGELFQEAWEQTLSGSTDAPNRWKSIEKKRFEALLNWKLAQVKNSTSSPWCDLKAAKPPRELFL